MPTVREAAIRAIGSEGPKDMVLAPGAHASELPPTAGTLRRVLERPETDEIIARFEAADREALTAQSSYVRWSRRAFWFRFLSIAFGTVALLRAGHMIETGAAVGVGLGLQYTLIAAALLVTLWLAASQPFERWMRARATAENARLDLFNRVILATEPERPGELPLLPLKLEYFRRYQLDVQRLYFRDRARRHAVAAGQTRQWQFMALALTVLALGPAALGFLGAFAGLQMPDYLHRIGRLAFDDAGRVIMLAIGIVGSALGDLTAALSLSRLDRRNAARYAANAQNLDFLAERYLEEARAAAASGESGPVRDFVDLVQGIISAEHREWMLLQDLAMEVSLEHLASLRVPGRRRRSTVS